MSLPGFDRWLTNNPMDDELEPAEVHYDKAVDQLMDESDYAMDWLIDHPFVGDIARKLIANDPVLRASFSEYLNSRHAIGSVHSVLEDKARQIMDGAIQASRDDEALNRGGY